MFEGRQVFDVSFLSQNRLRPNLALACCLLLSAACGSGSGPGTGPGSSGQPSRLLLLAADTLIVGLDNSIPMEAQARSSSGIVVPAGPVTWSSADPAIATVSDAGVVTGRGNGTVQIEATAGTLSASRNVVVVLVTGTGSDAVDRRIADFLARWGVPGASFAVVEGGRLVHAKGYGSEDAATGESVDPAALFRIASISKAITSLTAMTLVEAGRLDLDALVFPDILTSFWSAAQQSGADTRLGDIRVRDLLLHSGGWNRPPRDPMFMEREIAVAAGIASPPALDETIRYMIAEGLDFDPGTSAYYSNFGYALLGAVLERADGASYETIVRNRVLSPAGVSRAALGASLVEDRKAGEVAYHGFGSWGRQVPSVFDSDPSMVPLAYGGFFIESMAAHGGWVASSVDLARIFAAIDGDPTVPDLVSGVRRAEIGTPGNLPGNIFNYGMGWFTGSGGQWWHFGLLPGSAAYVRIEPGSGLAYVVLLNGSDPDSNFLGDLKSAADGAVRAVGSWSTGDLFAQFP